VVGGKRKSAKVGARTMERECRYMCGVERENGRGECGKEPRAASHQVSKMLDVREFTRAWLEKSTGHFGDAPAQGRHRKWGRSSQSLNKCPTSAEI
jgi:hypothetical protein